VLLLFGGGDVLVSQAGAETKQM